MKRTIDVLEALKDYGLSQADITRKTGIPQSRVSRWSAGRIPPGADDALKLSELAASMAKRKPRKQKAGD